MSIELKPRQDFLDTALACGASLTGKPDGSEAITVVFTIDAWRKFNSAIQQAEARTDDPVAYVCPTSHHAHDGSMEDGPDYLEWADEASDYEKRVGTPLYSHHAPGVPTVPAAALDRLMALLETQAAQIIELEDSRDAEPGVPEGFALVPLKATPKVAMVLYEGARNCFSPKVAEGLWQDALTAAQAQKGGE